MIKKQNPDSDSHDNHTSIELRDKLIKKFLIINKKEFDKKDDFYVMKDKEELEIMKRKAAIDEIVLIFESLNLDYNNPTKESILKVITELIKKNKKHSEKQKEYQEFLDIIEKDI